MVRSRTRRPGPQPWLHEDGTIMTAEEIEAKHLALDALIARQRAYDEERGTVWPYGRPPSGDRH